MLLLRAQERQLRGPLPTETAMANLLVINSSAAREDSISRVLIEEALPRLMCELDQEKQGRDQVDAAGRQ